MKRHYFFLILLSVLIFGSGCYSPDRNPDDIATVKLPIDGIFYTIETYYGHGLAIAPDITRVYAHLERAGKSIKILVLEGEDLTVKITWDKDNPHEVRFCTTGFIGIFQNIVTLIVGDTPGSSVKIHHNLKDCCDSSGCCDSKKCCNNS